jgi:hypothetical protein
MVAQNFAISELSSHRRVTLISQKATVEARKHGTKLLALVPYA